ncbi:MAG: hypothetical protein ACP5QI_02315, partial [Candidatus Bathyarchaeia archaeon]
LTYSFNPLTWTISIFAIFTLFLKSFNSIERRILPLWFLSFMIPLSLKLILEHHILNFMPSFILSIAYVLKDGWNVGGKKQRNTLLAAILLYLIALTVWHYIRIPSFTTI